MKNAPASVGARRGPERHKAMSDITATDLACKRGELEFHPLADLFPLIEGEDFDALVADVRANGLLEPVVIFDDKILDGRNRYRACQAAGIEPTFSPYQGDDPVAFVISMNLRRRHLDESQRSMVAAKLATLKDGQRADEVAGTSIEVAAGLLNVGRASVERAKAVQRAGATELVQAVEQGTVSVSAAADVATLATEEQRKIVARGEREILEAAKNIRAERAAAKRQERIAKLVEISKGNYELGTSDRFPVIYADPPWRYEHPPMGGNRVIENHYPTMALDEICALPVKELATDDAVLFMWATAPKLAECMQV